MNRLFIFVLLLLGLSLPSVFAQSVSNAQNVSVHVPSFLDLAASSNNINLDFQANQAGSETNAMTVTYTVSSNSMSQGDGAPGIIASLDNAFEGIDFKASFGTFSKAGGNAELVAASQGFVTLGDTPAVLATKANSSGDGKVLRGQFPITYQAFAKSQLAAGDYSRQLMLTLTDI